MSHEIDMTTGRAAVFVTGQPAWHGLGTVIEQAATSKEAIQLAGLAWRVEQWPVEAVDPQTQLTVQAPQQVANVRTDTRAVLGVVGRGYRVFQNLEAFEFMDALVGDKLAMYETAGALRGGRRVWMLARIPGEYRAGADDLIKPYVLLVNSHDGTISLRMIPTTVRVVCNNTLNLALYHANGQGLTIAHRASLEERVREAREKLGVVVARFDRFDEELHAMLSVQMTGRKLDDYFEQQLPAPTGEMTDRQKANRKAILQSFRANFEDPANTLPGVRGTAWAAYNAVSQWADHQRQFRGRDDHQRQENRLSSVWFGASHQLKQQAYRGALALAG